MITFISSTSQKKLIPTMVLFKGKRFVYLSKKIPALSLSTTDFLTPTNIHTVCPRIEFGRGKTFLFVGLEEKVILYKNVCLCWNCNFDYQICDYYTGYIKNIIFNYLNFNFFFNFIKIFLKPWFITRIMQKSLINFFLKVVNFAANNL